MWNLLGRSWGFVSNGCFSGNLLGNIETPSSTLRDQGHRLNVHWRCVDLGHRPRFGLLSGPEGKPQQLEVLEECDEERASHATQLSKHRAGSFGGPFQRFLEVFGPGSGCFVLRFRHRLSAESDKHPLNWEQVPLTGEDAGG